MAAVPSSTTKIRTLNSPELFLDRYRAFSQDSPQDSDPLTFSLISQQSPLPPVPTDFPQSKLIPKTRFVVDGFRSSGDFSVSYYLSHFHSDHYTGLNPGWSRGLIFCSDITGRLLVEVLKLSSSFVVSLSIRETVRIDGCDVTLVNANHCPGAVQFLFRIPGTEGKCERYIHTGDFRFCSSMKLEPVLREFVGADAIFLDTTYCNPKFVFPSQDESIDYIVKTIERIRIENCSKSKHVLFLVATYVIGKERILLQISRRGSCKIYVDSRKMAVLDVLGLGERGIFTEDISESDVHVVGWNVLGETWPYFRPNFVKMKEIMAERGYSKVVGFVPTGWMYEVKRDGFAVRKKDSFEIHLVPYSEHSSYDELREYVRFIRPKRVIPTVGLNVEKLDSKHAIAMRKHFAGLVDEMANKQQFLMNFHRRFMDTDDKGEEPVSVNSNEELDKEKEVESFKSSPENIVVSDPEIVLDFTSCLQEPIIQDSDVLIDKDNEEMIQELGDCLPVWVTREQMLDLLGKSGRNIVEAVSDFYERETEFCEQVTASACTMAVATSQPFLLNDSASLHEGRYFKDIPHQSVKSTSSQVNSTSTRHLVKGIVSPRKRGPALANKSKKKVRFGSSSSAQETSGSKQSTITKFFSKIVPCASDLGGASISGAEKCPDRGNFLSNEATEPYKEELDQFLLVISESMSRNHAASIIEKAKGDINMALELYYSNSCSELNEEILACSSKLSQTQYCASKISPGKGENLSKEKSNMTSLHVQGISAENVATNLVSLPLENYHPIEHACWTTEEPAPYLHLARTFDLVEGERSKIKATAMLCNMFRSLVVLSPKDVLPAVYLCTNKIAADHENIELNIGGSLVTAALKEACGTDKFKIKEMYNNLGDLGDVAQLCRQTQSLLSTPKPLLIQDVFSVLRKIRKWKYCSKRNLIVNLMRSCREKEMKFLVRTLVRNLRIGAMMKTILPALGQAVIMNSSFIICQERIPEVLKEKLQSISAAVVEAYNILPNLDLVVPSLMSKGIEFSSTTLSMLPGIPIRPMLARIASGVPEVLKLFEGRTFTCEYKYDGQRAQIHKLVDGSMRVFSRSGDETTSRFPDLVNIIRESCKPTAMTFILDAEIVAVDRTNGCKLMSFQELSSRERGRKDSLVPLESIKVDICIFVFDIMFANGEQLLSFPLRQRRKYLRDLFKDEKVGYFQYAKETTVEAQNAYLSIEATVNKINSFLEDALQFSCEGIMVKSLDANAVYAPSKRTNTWLKVKRDYVEGLNDSLDLVPIGAWHGNGRKAGWYSPFLMACYNPESEEFQSVCRVMSGFSDSFYAEMKEFFSGEKFLSKKPPYYQTAEVPDIWFTPELVWEIRGADFTISPVHQAAVGLVHPSRGISIRFPRFIQSVLDRRPEDCSVAADIADMFHSQTRKMDLTFND